MEKNIIKILLNYLKYWYLFLIGAIICLFLAFLHIRYNVTLQYYASGKILLNGKEEGNGLGSMGSLGLIKNSTNIADQIGVFESYDLMQKTIQELGFSVGYYVEGRFDELEIYEKSVPFKVVINDSVPLLNYGTLGDIYIIDKYSYRIENVNEDGTVNNSTHDFGEKINNNFGEFHLELTSNNFDSNSPIKVRFRSVHGLVSSFNSRLKVYSVNEGGGLLEISLTDIMPQRAVDVINKHIQVYAQNSANDKNFLANSTLELINKRLELVTNDLNIAEKGVEKYKRSNDLINVESDASRFVGLADGLDLQLSDLRSEISILNSLETSLSQSSGSFSQIGAYNVQQPLSGYILSYNLEVQNRKNLINASGLGNPQLPDIDRRLIESKNLIIQNVKGVKSQLTRTQRDLMNKLSQYRSKISSAPTAERALLEITRDQGIKQSLYLYLLQKREEEALSISVPFSDTRIIEKPKSTGYPINGGKMPVYLGAFLFGIFVPFAFVFIKETFNTKVLMKEDIETATEIPVLGKIARNKSKDLSAVVVTESNMTPVAELFRLMRHNLKFIFQGKNNQVIMVTSGKQGEGKTFVSINVAASLAITGKKVVVLGFDLRVPKLMKNMELTYTYGLSDFIVDSEVKVDDIITPSNKQKNLFFIGSGAIPPNPGELILNERVETLIQSLKKTYDYIVMDTPPIGKVADSFSLARFVDSTLFVVRYNYTTKEELKIINEVANDDKLNPLMIVFNDVKIDKSGAYSYGYGRKE